MPTGTDFLLESVLRLAGVNVDDAKAQILNLGRKFIEQDALLREVAQDQKTIIANQRAIMQALKITEVVGNGQVTERRQHIGSGDGIRLTIAE